MTIIKNAVSAIPEMEERTETKNYNENTYEIVSKAAFLLGVRKCIFENPHEAPKMDTYNALMKNKNARIIRNLCMIRTAIERGYQRISLAIKNDVQNLHTLPEYIPQECIRLLASDGIDIIKSTPNLNEYLVDINNHISNRINNCKTLFPVWLKWEYIRNLFVVEKGLSQAGVVAAAKRFYENMNMLPYQVFMNWEYPIEGNLLANDKKFVALLYEANEDYFTDMSKVSDAGECTKEEIYGFVRRSQKTVAIVDCENCDPYKLYATLNNLDEDEISKIYKIVLVDDVHTSSAWDRLRDFTEISIEHIETKRVKEDKSIVDTALTAKAVKEHYESQVDSIILFASDSDFWGMISELPDKVQTMVMIESKKCGPDLKAELENAGISYCYIDDFCTGNSAALKHNALIAEIQEYLEKKVAFNAFEMLKQAMCVSRAHLTTTEYNNFYERHIKSMKLEIADNGDVVVALG